MKKYEVIRSDRAATKCCIGDTVYASMKCDYGLANDDSRHSGVEHISVTFKEDGDYPFFTIPKVDLKELV